MQGRYAIARTEGGVPIKVNLDTCPDCRGRGQTRATRTEMEGKPLRTTALGSGCRRCHGTGVAR